MDSATQIEIESRERIIQYMLLQQNLDEVRNLDPAGQYLLMVEIKEISPLLN